MAPTPPAPTREPRPTRVFASGTLFQTHTFHLPVLPSSNTNNVVRAHAILKTLSGSAPTILGVLAHINQNVHHSTSASGVQSYLVAPLGGSDEGMVVIRQLEREGVNTKFSRVVEGAGVPGAWVMKSSNNGGRGNDGHESPSQSVILHNPLPDLTHEQFVTLLGPILAPENYNYSPTQSTIPPTNEAPFEWLHFEGRSLRTNKSNIQGIDGLARERGWRGDVVFSLDVSGKRGRHGGGRGDGMSVEMLIPHVDVVFFDRAYAFSLGYTSPRPFLLSMTSLAAPHALLIVNWSSPPSSSQSRPLTPTERDPDGAGGAALLSIPTREYLQSSPFSPPPHVHDPEDVLDISPLAKTKNGKAVKGEWRESVQSGSQFYADGQSIHSLSFQQHGDQGSNHGHGFGHRTMSDWEHSMYTISGNDHGPTADRMIGEEGEEEDNSTAHAVFMGAMIYALTRRLMPGSTSVWSPVSVPIKGNGNGDRNVRRWGLEESLRFATEFAGRRRHAFRQRRQWIDREKGLDKDVIGEMSGVGWF